jgi:hypothetical protein
LFWLCLFFLIQKPNKLFVEKEKKNPQFFHFGCVVLPFSKTQFFFVLGAFFFLVQEPKKLLQNKSILWS